MHKKHILLSGIYLNKITTFLLVAVFFVQPFHNIYAEEINESEDNQQIDISSDDTGSVAVEDSDVEIEIDADEKDIEALEEEVILDDESESSGQESDFSPAESSTDNATSTEGVNDNDDNISTSTELNQHESDLELVEDTSLDDVVSTTSNSASTSTTTTASSTTSFEQELIEDDKYDGVENEYQEVESSTNISNKNKYQFSSDECIVIEDGSFFCVQSSEGATELKSSSVYTDVGPKGYTDIFIRRSETAENITNSVENNSSPYYDEISNTIVFQSEHNGRNIIESYDLNTESIKRISNGQFNDVIPKRSGEYVVWQRWLNNAWQIVLYQGNEEKVITDSVQHNLSPSIYDGVILWTTFNQAGKKIGAYYDIDSKKTVYIDSEIEGRIQNPRFVLVYDTVLDSGDVITHGFDPETGTTKPISAFPTVPLPDIPSPDPVGEVRALTSKNNEDESELENLQTDKNATSTEDGVDKEKDIVVDSLEDDEKELEVTEYDMYVPEYSDEDE